MIFFGLLVPLETNIITGVSKRKYRHFYSVFIIALRLSLPTPGHFWSWATGLTSSKTKHSGDETLKRTCKREIRNAIVTVMQKTEKRDYLLVDRFDFQFIR